MTLQETQIQVCRHCGEGYRTARINAFCSSECAFRHLEIYYAAYGYDAAPDREEARRFYRQDASSPNFLPAPAAPAPVEPAPVADSGPVAAPEDGSLRQDAPGVESAAISTTRRHGPDCDPIHKQLRGAYISGPDRSRGSAGVQDWQKQLSRLRKLLPCGAVILALTMPTSTDAAVSAPRAERERPILTITVKVYADDGKRFKGADEVKGMPGARILLRDADRDSCTVWVNRDDVELQREAFRACQDASATATANKKGGSK